MKQDYFKNLPSEIITNILSRLPLRATALSKCVCKPWIDLLDNRDFVMSHLSKSALVLAVLMSEGDKNPFTLFELEDELELESHDQHYSQLTKFDFPHRVGIEGSSSGLLFLQKDGEGEANVGALYVCNPITREYIELPFHEGYADTRGATFGFGVSKVTSQHKLVCIVRKTCCHVYTLGTGSWRRVEAASASLDYAYCLSTVFLDGNLNWLVSDSDGTSDGTHWISCFDLETERFATFSVPPLQGNGIEYSETLSLLKGCLCVCYSTSEDDIMLWLMKEYGVKESWTKEYSISINPGFDRDGYVGVYPIKVFEDGDILMLWDVSLLFYYSNKTKTTQQIIGIGMYDGGDDYISPMLLTPTFLSLKSFGVENVFSF